MGGIASCEAKPKAKKPPPGPHEGPGSPISALGYQGVRLPGAVSTTQGQGEGPCATETRFSPVRRCPGHISHPAPPPRRRLTPCGHQTLSSCSQGRGRWRCSRAGAAGCQAGDGQKRGGGAGPREFGSGGTVGKGLCWQSKGHRGSSWGTSRLDRSGTSKGRAWGWKRRWEPTGWRASGARGTDSPHHCTAPGELPVLAQEDTGCWQRTAQPQGTEGHGVLRQGRPRLKQPQFICVKVSGSLGIKGMRKMVKRQRWAKHRAGP